MYFGFSSVVSILYAALLFSVHVLIQLTPFPSHDREAIRDIVEHQISAMYQHDFVPPKSNMLNQYKEILEKEAIELHNKFGAVEWGIPPELYEMYKEGYLSFPDTQIK